MAESSYERGLRHGQEGRRPDEMGGNFFTKMLGPLPVWAWAGLLLVGVVMYYFWQKKQTSSASSSTTAGAGASTTDSSMIPQFVNQTYVTGEPPSDGNNGPPPGSNGGNGTPTTNYPPGQGPGSGSPPPTATTHNDYSWTDTGQRWTLDELAKRLGVSVGALRPANAAATHTVQAYGKGNRKKLIPKGAHFTYTKQPKQVTTFG